MLVVVKAFDYRRDLVLLKSYLRENSPVLIGVDGGADALIAAGHRPDIVICDGDDISEAALRCGAEVDRQGRRTTAGSARASASNGSACGTRRSRPAARPRMPPCCSPTSTAPR